MYVFMCIWKSSVGEITMTVIEGVFQVSTKTYTVPYSFFGTFQLHSRYTMCRFLLESLVNNL